MTYFYLLLPLLLLLGAYPIRNWLEIRSYAKQDQNWMRRINELPSKDIYCQEHERDGMILCNYCHFERQRPQQEATVPHEPQFGLISNVLVNQSQYTIYSCARCGTQLYGEKIIKG